jgi:pyridoxamine 5'-phosphate oxidase family protein
VEPIARTTLPKSFSTNELEYIKSQPLARIATVSNDGQPDVVPVGYEYDGKHFYIGSIMMKKTTKFWNVKRGNNKVSLVIDDLVSQRPWRPRGIKVKGTAEIVEVDGESGKDVNIMVTPDSWRSWGLDAK